jgi:hypothetical protein
MWTYLWTFLKILGTWYLIWNTALIIFLLVIEKVSWNQIKDQLILTFCTPTTDENFSAKIEPIYPTLVAPILGPILLALICVIAPIAWRLDSFFTELISMIKKKMGKK